MNNTVFEKTLENARKHRNMEHVTIKKIKKLSGMRTNLSDSKVYYKKCISNRNENN